MLGDESMGSALNFSGTRLVYFICVALLWSCGFPEEIIQKPAFVCTSPNPHSPIADYGKEYMHAFSRSVAMMREDKFGQVQTKLLQIAVSSMKRPMEGFFSKKRPCGCDGSFPSGHMIHIGWPASFIYHRYGWQYGIPVYVGSTVFANDRHNAKAHYWSDLIGTTLLMHGIGYFTVSPYQPQPNHGWSTLDRFHFLLKKKSFLITYDLHPVK